MAPNESWRTDIGIYVFCSVFADFCATTQFANDDINGSNCSANSRYFETRWWADRERERERERSVAVCRTTRLDVANAVRRLDKRTIRRRYPISDCAPGVGILDTAGRQRPSYSIYGPSVPHQLAGDSHR